MFLLLFIAVPFFVVAGWGVNSRGIRNNNPGNIRWDNKTQWRGMLGVDDKGFIIFDSPVNGIRAMARVLASYKRRGVSSVAEIIATWAPSTENNTSAYIDHVAQLLNKNVGDTVNESEWPQLVAAIIKHENGEQPYSMATIRQGIAAA